METKFKEELRKLKQLQGIDVKIYDLEEKLKNIPQRLEELRQGLEEKKVQVDNLKNELKTLQVERKGKELTLQAEEEKIKKLEGQLYQIKTNREYSSLQTEIGGKKADNSLLEEEILLLLDRIDEENRKLEGENKLLAELREELNAEETVLNNERESIEKELSNLKTQRGEMASRIDSSLVSRYEKIARGKGGMGMALLKDGTCHGCFMKVPPQVSNELRLGNKIVRCENCSRILYEE